MAALLKQAFTAAEALPAAEQDVLAARLLAEVSDEDDFDRALAASGERLAGAATAALAEHRAGESLELDPDRL